MQEHTYDINTLIEYDIILGAFYLKKNSKIVRRIFPTEEGYLIFFRDCCRLKLRANKVAIQIVTGEIIPKSKAILHKNLDENDYRLQNLKIISKISYNKVKEAYRNLSGALKMLPHNSDVFSYVISWKEDNKEKKTVVSDIVIAKRIYAKLELKYAKILNKYCVFD